LNDALFEFIEKDWVSPGESVTTKMWLLSPELQTGRLYEGLNFTIHEGHRTVASGTVTKVLNIALRQRLDGGSH